MMYAFSRDRAVPGHQLWSKVAPNRAPRNATLAMAVIAAIVTLPALYGNAARVPVAFYALASVTVVGLYIAYIIPVYLRWRMGDSFVPGPWTLGNKYKWMCPMAVIEVIVVCIIAFLPTAPGGVPGNADFAWNNGLINYCPLIVGAVALYAFCRGTCGPRTGSPARSGRSTCRTRRRATDARDEDGPRRSCGCGGGRWSFGTKDSPLRLAFRPPVERTFESPLRPVRLASTYSAALSGAGANLWHGMLVCKRIIRALCEYSE